MKAVIFDMNGVIVDDERIHQESWRQLCKKYNFQLTEEEFKDKVFGRIEKETFEYLFKHELTDEEVAKYSDERVKIAIEIIKPNLRSTEGNIETISETFNLIGTPKNISGPIIKQISEAHEYVLTLLRAGIRVPSGFTTTYLIPERAVKEAITNAVIHRDYQTKKDITIKIFEDRIEIESPGLLPFNITPSNIGIDRAYGYRNDLLVKHLREFPDPPNLDQNEGVRAMRITMHRENLYPPIFYTYPYVQDTVRVILFNLKATSEWDKISEYLTIHKYISNNEARKVLGMVDTVKVSKILSRWVKQGLLTKIVPRIGAKRNVRYRLPSSEEKSLFVGGESK